MIRAIVPTRILRRWDQIAIAQLAQAAVRMSDELAELRETLYRTEDAAQFWSEQAMGMQLAMCEEQGGSPGITKSGQLVVVKQ